MDKFKKVLDDCMNDWDVGDDDEDAEWPYNAISKNAVFNFEDGYFGENKTPISKDEVELCKKLSHEASKIYGDRDLALSSSGSEPFVPFWLVATKEEEGKEGPKKVTAELIRERFNGTIFPPSIITIYPLNEDNNKFRDEINDNFDDSSEADNPWWRTIEWFKAQKDFIDTAMVYVGQEFPEGNEEDYPEGTECSPCCLPRMMLGLTKNGSLTGLFSYIVDT